MSRAGVPQLCNLVCLKSCTTRSRLGRTGNRNSLLSFASRDCLSHCPSALGFLPLAFHLGFFAFGIRLCSTSVLCSPLSMCAVNPVVFASRPLGYAVLFLLYLSRVSRVPRLSMAQYQFGMHCADMQIPKRPGPGPLSICRATRPSKFPAAVSISNM
jgi:hypothetical protein